MSSIAWLAFFSFAVAFSSSVPHADTKPGGTEIADALRKLFVCLQMDELTRIAEAAKNGGELQERSGAAE